ncbi:uncharacterized protein VTP21DRAFT_1967 [Calcarisporiella thermophila]|uniref:uncharacterized protein n=1 Tax=Calcarisporiella thermophila TaxID=911321 RepID=UPI00374483AB
MIATPTLNSLVCAGQMGSSDIQGTCKLTHTFWKHGWQGLVKTTGEPKPQETAANCNPTIMNRKDSGVYLLEEEETEKIFKEGFTAPQPLNAERSPSSAFKDGTICMKKKGEFIIPKEVQSKMMRPGAVPLSIMPRRWLFDNEDIQGRDPLVRVPRRRCVWLRRIHMDHRCFTLLSWNLLSPSLHGRQSKPAVETTPSSMKWCSRREQILDELAFRDADVLCLQEVDETDYSTFFEPRLSKLGYRGIYAKKMHVEIRDGCAIFWRESR